MVRAEIGTIDINSLNNWTTVAVTSSPYELTGLTPETTYFLRVKSIFADGESKYTRISVSTSTSYTDRSAVNGTYYYYRIWCMNASNTVIGEWSNARAITCNR